MENKDSISTNEKKTEVDEEDDYHYITPEDLIIIYDTKNWEPSEKIILSYAEFLGYDPNKDPEEILKISEKYLNMALPNNCLRAFTNDDNNQILYLDIITQELELESSLETKAKEEIEECRKRYNTNKELIGNLENIDNSKDDNALEKRLNDEILKNQKLEKEIQQLKESLKNKTQIQTELNILKMEFEKIKSENEKLKTDLIQFKLKFHDVKISN